MKNIFLIIAFFNSVQLNAQWQNAVVDTLTHNTAQEFLSHQCLDIDKTNIVHLVYSRDNTVGNNVFYRQRDASHQWLAEDSIPSQSGQSAVVIASHTPGQAFVAFSEIDTSGHDQIFVCSNQTATWNCQNVTNSTLNNTSPSIDIDSAGKIHLAWIGEDSTGNYKIYYATNLSGTWNIQRLSASQLGMFGGGAIPSVGVENNGIAHIAFRGDNGNGFRIHHAYNNSPGDSVWQYEIIATPNDEDLSQSLMVKDTTVQLLISGDDGFGFPVEAFYQKKNKSDTAFSPPDFVASSFRAGIGDLFIDNDSQPHVVLDEIAGNIFTGNIIYANPNSWNGIVLLSGNVLSSHLVIDNEDNGLLIALAVNSPTAEIIAYGSQLSAAIINPADEFKPVLCSSYDKKIRITILKNYSGNIKCLSSTGKIIFSTEKSFTQNESVSIENLSAGVYFLSCSSREKNFVQKIIVE